MRPRAGRRCLALVLLIASISACTDGNDHPTAASSSNAPIGSTIATASTAATSSSTTTTTLDVDGRAAQLQGAIDHFVAQQPVPFSVVVVDVATGARATHLSDRVVLSASLYKLFVARELLRRIDAGELDRRAPAGDGEGRTIEECIHDMIVVSDNACGSAGLRIVGQGALDARLHADGFVSTSLTSPQRTSADDVARFFDRARSSPELAELYRLLQAQQINDRLPMGLPAGTPLAHKTGDRRQWAHDAGVMTTPRGDVLIVVLSGPWPLPCCDADHPGAAEQEAFGAIADLGRVVYQALA